MSKNTSFITGAPSGLGHALARHVLMQGDKVVLGARTVGPMNDLAKEFRNQALVVELDVTDASQRVGSESRQ
jgi:NADP-dependent 3-hydroxy acid dehydrogenase YdfG